MYSYCATVVPTILVGKSVTVPYLCMPSITILGALLVLYYRILELLVRLLAWYFYFKYLLAARNVKTLNCAREEQRSRLINRDTMRIDRRLVVAKLGLRKLWKQAKDVDLRHDEADQNWLLQLESKRDEAAQDNENQNFVKVFLCFCATKPKMHMCEA